MPRYCITYADPDATYPAPKKISVVDMEKENVWDHAITLGTVKTIFDLDILQTVYSINWNHNRLDFDQSQINDNLTS